MAQRTGAGRKFLPGLLIGLIGFVFALTPWSLNWLSSWEAKTWDWRATLLAGPGYATDDIRLILLDQNSLDWALKENGLTWPWPRELYGAIVNFCERSGAKAVAFDVLFTEPSKYGQTDDSAFGSAVAEFGHFAGTVFLGRSSGNARHWPPDLPLAKLKVSGLDKWLAEQQNTEIIFPRVSLPIPELARSAAVLCNIHLTPDKDGIYRRVRPFGLFDKTFLVSLGLGTYLAANLPEPIAISAGNLKIGDRFIPIDKQGNTFLRFRGPSGTHQAYSAAAVLQSEIRIRNGQTPTIRNPNAFKNKYVFFGFSAPGLYDLRSAPVGGVYTGVEIHATMLDNFLSGDFIRSVPTWVMVCSVISLSILCAIGTVNFNRPLGILFNISFFVCIPVIAVLIAYARGFWLPLVVLEVAVVFTIALATIYNFATEGRQKRFIKNAFKQYLSPAVIEQLLQNPERLSLGGERRVLSIFFSDLQGFTSISEGLEPEVLTNLLNDYLSAMTDIIHEEGGTVDKYEGDAIIAFWNAPLEVSDHAVRVVRAALRCQEKLHQLRPVFKNQIGKEMLMRIGINTGSAVVGNMGSRTRFDYTMLGDAVNLAARLEGTNKQFGTYTMISQSTLALAGDHFAVRELARVAVVGRKEPVTVYEPMFKEEYQKRKTVLNTFDKALQFFYAGDFKTAQQIFDSIGELDPVARSYQQKCSELLEKKPQNWNGVWVMTTK